MTTSNTEIRLFHLDNLWQGLHQEKLLKYQEPIRLRIPIVDAGGSCLDIVEIETNIDFVIRVAREAKPQSPYDLIFRMTKGKDGVSVFELIDQSDVAEEMIRSNEPGEMIRSNKPGEMIGSNEAGEMIRSNDQEQ